MGGIMKEEFALVQRMRGVQTLLASADVDKVVTTANMKNGAYTIAAQPGVPSRISVSQTAGDTADTPGIVTVVGTNDLDQDISEVITPEAGTVVYGELYFKTVTSATGSGWAIDEAEATNDTITIGVSVDSEIILRGRSITLINVSGNFHINPLALPVADATSLKLSAGQSIDLCVRDTLRLISDGSAATFQFIVWEG